MRLRGDEACGIDLIKSPRMHNVLETKPSLPIRLCLTFPFAGRVSWLHEKLSEQAPKRAEYLIFDGQENSLQAS
jgi:hypothetical protein